jgi:hypothetical protein
MGTSLLERIGTAAAAGAGSARSLPFAAYTDPEIFAREMDEMFRRDFHQYLAWRLIGATPDKRWTAPEAAEARR